MTPTPAIAPTSPSVSPATLPAGQTLLKGKVPWLLVPSSIAATPIGGATVFYCMRTVDLPAGSTVPLLWLVLGVAVTLGIYANRQYAARLRLTQGIGAGKLPASPENLAAAAAEIHALPDYVFKMILTMWFFGVGIAAAGLAIICQMGLGQTLRLIASGLLLCPIGALLARLATTSRSRRLIEQFSQTRLPAQEILRALPSRQQLRRRLMIFASILVATPGIVTADIAVSVLRRGFDRVQHAPIDQQAIVSKDAIDDALAAVFILGGMVFGIGMSAAYLGGGAIGEPLRALAEEASRISGGDLRERRLVIAEDEIWAVSSAIVTMQSHLTRVLAELRRAGLRISGATHQMLEMSEKSEAGANEQASSAHQTSAATEELARTAAQIAENAGAVAKMAQGTLAAAQSGQANSQAFIQSMGAMRQDNRAIADSVNQLNRLVQQIGRIVEFINGVADKADLLALNAELEGTKAGEVGRGFSLVAGEMRRLAENVIRSTREIEQLIRQIREATQATVKASEAGVRATENGAQLAQQLSQNLEQIYGLAKETSTSAQTISTATAQQQSSSTELASAMADILKVTQQSLASSKQISGSSAGLTTLATELKTVVETFVVD